MKRQSSSGTLSTKIIKRWMPGERSGRLHIDEEHLNETTNYGYGYLHDETESLHTDELEDDEWEDKMSSSDFKDLKSLHEIRQKACVSGWKSIRSSLLTMLVENSGIPFKQSCITCMSDAFVYVYCCK